MTAPVAQVLEELRAGRRVLVAASTGREARAWLREVMDQLVPEDGARVGLTSGRELIRHASSGWARFGSVASERWRGLSADTVLLPAASSERERRGILPCVLASADHRVVEL